MAHPGSTQDAAKYPRRVPRHIPSTQPPLGKSTFAQALHSALTGNSNIINGHSNSNSHSNDNNSYNNSAPQQDVSLDSNAGSTASRKEVLNAKLASGEAPWDMISLRAAINSATPGD